MFKFPQGLYTDVRIEDVFQTNVLYTMGKLSDCKEREYTGAFIRVYDGERWYYSSTSDIDNLQVEIDKLASYAKPKEDIHEDAIVSKFQVHSGVHIKFDDEDLSKVSIKDKMALVQSYFPIVSSLDKIKVWRAQYIDERKVKQFYSSKGANLTFDSQRTGFSYNFSMAIGEKKLAESFQKGSNYFKDLFDQEDRFKEKLEKCEHFLENSVAVEPGIHTIILSPIAAGVFAHESFGHKSEADFMIGDEAMKKEWSIGRKVGSDILSIVDTGTILGSGYVPFDDDGNQATETYLIKDGALMGRLHSSITAASLEEATTGNARAMNFEFEPIVRMTTTYILPGSQSKEELFGSVKDGLYVETIKHGSGMSTFTIAPSLSYRIRDGKIAEPVNISVITGNVFETLNHIDGLSDTLEILAFITGGCGKNEQHPLAVGFGGPYVKVSGLNAQ